MGGKGREGKGREGADWRKRVGKRGGGLDLDICPGAPGFLHRV